MKINEEILVHSVAPDIPVLLWLFQHYHWESQWKFVAKCSLKRYGKMSYESHRIWTPTPEGRVLYAHQNDLERFASETRTK